MGTKEKLIERLKSTPKDFTFDEMQSALESLGFANSLSRIKVKRADRE